MHTSAHLFYFPALHRDRVPPNFAAAFSLFSSGLPAKGGPRSPAEAAFAEALPLSEAEAKDALNQLLALGADHAEHLKNLASSALHTGNAAEDEERAALAVFSRNGTAPEGPRAPKWGAAARTEPTEEEIRSGLVECQKTLLLAYALEADVMEAEALAARVRGSNNGLLAALGDGTEEETEEDFAALATEAGLSAPEAPSWRLVVEASLPFLPEESILFTADPVAAADLLESGMLHPLPEDKAELCPDLPAELKSRLLWTRVPAVRLTGRKSIDPRRPWLERTVEVLVLRPLPSGRGAI